MYRCLRSLLFQLDAETSHDFAMKALGLVSCSPSLNALSSVFYGKPDHTQAVEVMGISFPNPVGLAAGLDKQATAANALHQMGFGWLELGTVTPKPQPGNPKPRLFRIPEHQAIINRFGFNSVGLSQFVKNLQRIQPGIIKGINIGKNASTPLDLATEDYLIGLRAVYRYADYVAINISSPNTKNLRELQQNQALDELLGALDRERQSLVEESGKAIPLVVKIAPDLESGQIQAISTILRKNNIDGVVATNTTLSRDQINQHPLASEVGGLSGKPVRNISTEVVAALYQHLGDDIPIIGVGGIYNAESASEKFQAGAKLIQLYSGFIYQGPKLISQILEHLSVQR
jgi:dihydroorotate dehydrogenase